MAEYTLSPLGFDFIRKQEGFPTKPYWDVRQWSTGFGTRASGPNDVVDRPEAERRLADEAGKVSSHLGRNVRVPMTQGQHDALVSFGYNLGTDDIDKLIPDINAGNWGRVGQRMLSFNRAGGEVHPVLVARRKAEADMLGGGAGEMPAKPSYLAQALNMAGVVPGAGPAGMLPAVMAAPAGSGGGMAGPGRTPIGGAPIAGGPVPLTAPNMRYSKLADALLASAAGAKPRGWGELLNAAGDLALGYTLGNRADEEQKTYKGKLAEALLGASDNDAMAKTLMATGDDDLVKQGVALKVAQGKPQLGRFTVDEKTGAVWDNATGKQVTEGKAPKPKLDVADRKEIFEADEGAQAATNVMGSIDKAIELNDSAYSGPLAETRGYIGSLFGAEGGVKTEELQNVVMQQVLDNLKATFGAAPTEGERQILIDIQGSVNKAPEVRKRIFEAAKAAAERRLKFNQERAGALRSGDYYNPGYSPTAPASPTAAPPAATQAPAQKSAAPQQQAPAAAPKTAPPQAIEMLRGDPSPQRRQQFDAIFGQGAADRALGPQSAPAPTYAPTPEELQFSYGMAP